MWASYILQNVYINLPANIKVYVSYIERRHWY